MKQIFHILIIIALFSTNCATSQGKEREMSKIASFLTKLSSKVESSVRFGNMPDNIQASDILEDINKADPRLMSEFDDYKVMILIQGKLSEVLICSKDKKHGLLEDAGCTGRMDKHLWKLKESHPCNFTLSLEIICR